MEAASPQADDRLGDRHGANARLPQGKNAPLAYEGSRKARQAFLGAGEPPCGGPAARCAHLRYNGATLRGRQEATGNGGPGRHAKVVITLVPQVTPITGAPARALAASQPVCVDPHRTPMGGESATPYRSAATPPVP